MIGLVSLLWSAINGLRRALYRAGIFSGVRLPLTTISVGNIEAGGTGKTPLVMELARAALLRGKVPLILTRGHGGEWSRSGPGVIEPGPSIVDPALCGDEAALIHLQVPGAWIGVCSDRVAGFHSVMELTRKKGLRPPDCVILDDGYQHLQIQRDHDVVLLTSAGPSERVHREWPSPLSGKNLLLVWTKGEVPPRPWVGSREGRYRIFAEPPAPQGEERQEKIWLVSGIGAPAEFERSVREKGWNVIRHTRFADHARYSKDWLVDLFGKASSQGLRVATTGKDWVKWSALGINAGQARVFEPSLRFDPAPISDKIFP